MKDPQNSFVAAFAMTREEKKMLALVVFVAATGLAARYFYLRGRRPVAFHPANVPASSAPANRAQVEE